MLQEFIKICAEQLRIFCARTGRKGKDVFWKTRGPYFALSRSAVKKRFCYISLAKINLYEIIRMK